MKIHLITSTPLIVALGGMLMLAGCDPRENQTETDQSTVVPAPAAEPLEETLSAVVDAEGTMTDEETSDQVTLPELDPTVVLAQPSAVNLASLELDVLTERYLDPKTAKAYSGPAYTVLPNGKVGSEGPVTDGYQDGDWVEYHENSKVAAKGPFKKGFEDGLWIFYWENGNIQTEGTFKESSPHGVWTTYDDQGRMDSKGRFENGLMDGVWEYFNAETGTSQQFIFNQGKRVVQ